MTGIQLKIKGEWIVLPDDFSLNLEQSSPVFNEQGTFSFPFEVPLEPNRYVFKNISDPFGDITLKDIDGLDAELWFNGIMLYKGKTETEDETEITDSIPLTFISGNSDFNSRIDGLNARSVPLDREIKLGYVVDLVEQIGGDSSRFASYDLPNYMAMNYTEYNVSEPYPIKPYCNVRVCTQGLNKDGDQDGYQVLPAKRSFSGVCFYMMYWLDCLFKYLGMGIEKENISDMEDINRLAFFTTQCNVTYGTTERNIPLSEIRNDDFLGKDFTLIVHYNRYGRAPEVHVETDGFRYAAHDVYATNENFPDVDASDIISDLKNAFGMLMIYDDKTNVMQLLYIKDVLKDPEVIQLPLTILSVALTKENSKAVRLTYGNDSDTAFNYNDYSNVVTYSGYKEILEKGISENDRTCKIDLLTGNAYRVKVNKDTGQGASLSEVGGFRDYITDENASKDNLEDISINFAPAIVNDVRGGGPSAKRYNNNVRRASAAPSIEVTDTNQELAVFANVELKQTGDEPIYDKKEYFYDTTVRNGTTTNSVERGYYYLKCKCYEIFDMETTEKSPLQDYDAGYTVGIMRGPGNKSGLEFVANYDGEGNDAFSQVSANYAFSPDICDNYGRLFDYNGTLPGGTPGPGNFSLKLIAEKPGYPVGTQYANRGLVAKFMNEYLYFLSHRKLIIMDVVMNISDIIHINFLKKHKIGEYVGFINKISYSLDMQDVRNVQIELYIL